jgi:hypothetical protein
MANAAIEVLGRKINRSIRSQNRKPEMLVLGLEIGEARYQPARRERRHGTEAYLVAVAMNSFDCGLDTPDGVSHAVKKCLPIPCDCDALPCTVQQSHSELPLEIPDQMGDG